MTQQLEILRVKTYPATDQHDHFQAFDNTKLVAVNTCPTWGIVRYTYHKIVNETSRAMALEAGSAAHEAFAAHRLYELKLHGAEFYNISQDMVEQIFNQEGIRIFGTRKWEDINAAPDQREDIRTQRNQFILEALYSSGFYDDPFDKRRTLSNLEELVLAYNDTYSFKNMLPVVFNKKTKEPVTPDCKLEDLFVGIEIPVNILVEITYRDNLTKLEKVLTARFTGKADGIHYKDKTKTTMRVHENKTASRLDDAWSTSFETNHQPTGYMIGVSSLLDVQINEALILGTALPLPRNFAINGIMRIPVTRKDWQIKEWFSWFLHTVLLHNEYVDDVANAPQYTHSCNRYFRACSFISLCATPPEERLEFIEDLPEREWSPLLEDTE